MRQKLREFNRNLSGIKDKYFNDGWEPTQLIFLGSENNFNIVSFCMHLLDVFYVNYPDMHGIWADYYHIAHTVVLAIIRSCFEFGFFTFQDAQKMIPKLTVAVDNLKRLEVAWAEKLNEISEGDRPQLYEIIKANVCKCFLNIREHISAILMQIITIIYDHHFVESLP
jgi:hypothetical protein